MSANPAKNRERGKKKGAASDAASPEEESGDLLGMDEAARLVKTTRQTFYRWVRQGKIRGMKTGRQWRFERAEIERFLRGEEPKIDLRADIGPLLKDLAKQCEEAGADKVSLPQDGEVERAVADMVRLAIASRASHISRSPLSSCNFSRR